jgi:hypothetical protein
MITTKLNFSTILLSTAAVIVADGETVTVSCALPAGPCTCACPLRISDPNLARLLGLVLAGDDEALEAWRAQHCFLPARSAVNVGPRRSRR